jgi:hypothetical protein
MTTDPLEFLRAALDARQEQAKAAAELCGCHPPASSWVFGDEETDGRILVKDEPHPGVKRKIGRRWNGSYEGMHMAQHVIANDPAAVLRRIAADRKILELHAPVPSPSDGPYDPPVTICRTCSHDLWAVDPAGTSSDWYPCDTVRALAVGYGWSVTPGS